MPAADAPDFELETRLHRSGYLAVAGLDEVGRGTLAGPVAAGAVILPKKPRRKVFKLVRDSKQMSAPQRDEAYDLIVKSARSCAVGWADASEIDRYGIVPSVRLAMRRALGRLDERAQHLLIDALALPSTNLPQTSIVRGDSKSLSIAAASVIAKVERDRFMIDLAESYPGYGFESHKGYGTQQHLEAIRELGPSPAHRMTFRPVAYSKVQVKRVHPSVSGEWARVLRGQRPHRPRHRDSLPQLQNAVRRGGPDRERRNNARIHRSPRAQIDIIRQPCRDDLESQGPQNHCRLPRVPPMA